MITNLVAAVAFLLATNVTEVVTEWDHFEPGPYPPIGADGIAHAIYIHHGVDPIAKQVTSNIAEVATLSFEWDGQKHEVKHEKVLASTVTTIRKSVEWRATPNTLSMGGLWATNMQDAARKGRMWAPSGSKNYLAKFSDDEIKAIRSERKDGQTIRSLAIKYCVAFRTMHRICINDSYKSIP